MARLAGAGAIPPARPAGGCRLQAWLPWLAVAAVAVLGVTSLVAFIVVRPLDHVTAGPVVVAYERDWLQPAEARTIAEAHAATLKNVELVTGLHHQGRIGVTVLRAPGRDQGGAGGIVLHFEGLDRSRIEGYRPPAHELVHVLAAPLSKAPSPLLREGVAVYVAWQLEGGGSPSAVPDDLTRLEHSDAFTTAETGRDTTVEYEAAGTVVRYLVETYGWSRFWTVYAGRGSIDSVARRGLHESADRLRCDVSRWLLRQGVASERAGTVGTCPTA